MIDKHLPSIIRSLSNARRGEFFNTAALALYHAIDADHAIIGRPGHGGDCNSIAYVTKGQIRDNIHYFLKDTPCADVLDRNLCVFNGNVQKLYPKDQMFVDCGIHSYIGVPLLDSRGQVIGLICALYHHTIPNANAVEALLLLFSDLIAGEMERRHVQQKCQLSNSIIANANEGIVISDSDRSIIDTNHAFLELTGHQRSELIGRSVDCLLPNLNNTSTHQQVWQNVTQSGRWSGELWCQSSNGKLQPIWLTINAISTNDQRQGQAPQNYVLFFSDLSEHKAAEQKIHFQANYDSLTRLANRHLFTNRLTQCVHQAERNHHQFAVLFIDLDLFKMVNDSLGHNVGDRLLKKVARRLAAGSRKTDTLARLGGDEFTLLLDEVRSPEQAGLTASKLLASLAELIDIGPHRLSITASIGIALFPNDGDNAEQLLAHADQAMYNAKNAGKNCFCFFTSDMQRSANQRMSIKHKLTQALSHQHISAAYQPIINLANGRVEKFEALARWSHNGEPVSPVKFIPVAEEFGLISQLGEQVLNHSCRLLRQLHDQGFDQLGFTINRSAKEFPRRSDEHPNWLEIIQRHNLTPAAICFEVTESVLAPDSASQKAFFNRLKIAGSTIAIDDFGTGYSSLNYLRQFPVDILKIDRSFIADFTRDQEDLTLVSTIIAMAKSLGLTVIAEGVETQQQLNQLIKLGCQYAQGYYFSRPLDANQVLPFLQQQRQLTAPKGLLAPS